MYMKAQQNPALTEQGHSSVPFWILKAAAHAYAHTYSEFWKQQAHESSKIKGKITFIFYSTAQITRGLYFSESEYIGNKIPAKISNARSNAGTNHWPSGSINSQPTLEASKAFKQSLSDIALLNPCIGDFGTLFQWNGTQQQQGPNNFRI